MKNKLLLLAMVATLFSCTENQRAKRWGGKTTIDLPVNQRLIHVTWKEGSLWYMTEVMDGDYIPKPKVFKEKSSYGVVEGEIVFIESKSIPMVHQELPWYLNKQ